MVAVLVDLVAAAIAVVVAAATSDETVLPAATMTPPTPVREKSCLYKEANGQLRGHFLRPSTMGALIIRTGWGVGGGYILFVIRIRRNPQNSIGNYLGNLGNYINKDKTSTLGARQSNALTPESRH